MSQQKLAHQPKETEGQNQRVLLVVDDDPIMRHLCAQALSTFHVIQANDGKEALEILDKVQVDIILSDIMMPNMSGLELLLKVKERQPDQTMILVTGYTEKDVILQALKAGADDFISKPIKFLQLRTTVEKILDKKLLREELLSLKKIDKLKSDFLGLISHKLKTPATSLSLFIQNLDDEIDPQDEGFKKSLAMAGEEARHLEHLIQDLLYFSNVILQNKDLEMEPVEFGRIAWKVASLLEPVARNKSLQYEISITPPLPPKPLILDRERLTFAIRALIDNAIKFTPEGGCVHVEGKLLDGQVQLIVQDTGVGIEPSENEKIFNKFYQIDPGNTGQVRGFGLGLYYARDFVRSMGGQLFLVSSPGIGTEVTVAFPLPR
jgi:signal transduction histidine kinase